MLPREYGILLFGWLTPLTLWGHENHDTLPEIVVEDGAAVQGSRLDRGAVLPTERIHKRQIERKRAHTLTEAVAGETGIDTQTSCANCGAKRITINGLRGEHTTILVDGVPLHSAVSSFYGVDAVPMAGVEAIEVTRGAGASLTAPEAMGGVINIITESPRNRAAKADLQLGTAGARLISGSVSETLWDGKVRLLGAGQWSSQGLWDGDANGISEFPDFTNGGALAKLMVDLGSASSLEFRYAWQKVSILGGTTNGTRPTAPPSIAGHPAFEGNDVHRRYLDTQDKIADVIDLARHEVMGRWKIRVGDSSQVILTSSGAWQAQDSIYFHGYDYSNRDFLGFQEGRFSTPLNDENVMSFGLDGRLQNMKSKSEQLYTKGGLPPDDFEFRNVALFAQNTWSPSPQHEVAAAVRSDWLWVSWPFQSGGRRLERLLVSPRLHWKWAPSSAWTLRASYGRGYRAPLSFFESQHGLNEDGFSIGLTEIESADTLSYTAHYLDGYWEFGAGIYGTLINNVAYAEDSQTVGGPAVFKNLASNLGVFSSYLSATYRPDASLMIDATLEDFRLPLAFKRLLPAAIMEQRLRVRVEKIFGKWEASLALNLFGPRDLTHYKYDQHYRTWKDVPRDPLQPLLGTVPEVGERKNTRAPVYATLDFTLAYRLSVSLEISASVFNLTNFTQVGFGDSPLAWGQHGPDPRHFHLDNMHVWGPLRGRTYLLGLKAQL